jgi:hypothetical protein
MLGKLRRLSNWLSPHRPWAQKVGDEELDLVCPPQNPEDAAGWDCYWSEQNKYGLGPLFDIVCHDHLLVRTLKDEGMSRILCAGNGISFEPQALAAAGFAVVALDLSPRATEIARSLKLDTKRLEHFLDPAMVSSGGRADFVVGDIRDSTICRGPFDAVIERCTAQLYNFYGTNEILDKLAERLDSNGILISHCHDRAWRPPAERRHANRSWFEENGWTIWSGDPAKKPAGRVAFLSVSTG